MGLKQLLLFGVAAVLLMIPDYGYAGGSPAIKIVIPKIDYPAAGVIGTRVQDVNNSGNTDFDLNTAAGAEVGYRPFGGAFIIPQMDPNAVTFTQPDQMNNSNTMAGDYLDANGVFHGFTLNSGTFTTFDVSAAGSAFTAAFGINDQGDLAGEFGAATATVHNESFVVVSGVETDFDVSGAAGDFATAINNGDVAVGTYSTTDPLTLEATCGCHGYMRAANGTVTTFDPVGSVSTVPHGLNNKNIVVGRYYDSGGVVHGFVYFLNHPASSFTYDYPGATQTSLNGINDNGYIAGRYTDSSNVAHGFIAHLSPGAAGAAHRHK
ncbi:MAG TPA: hypothetical protein VKS22_05040 [Candidatus Binataceae bacterium]|nr:hypothetical protein [Candidatus Binataceae bacterium]